MSQAVGTPIEDRPRRRLGRLQRRADQIRALALVFLFLSLVCGLAAGAAAYRGQGSVTLPALLALLAGDIGFGLRQRRPRARLAAAIALHLMFAVSLLSLPERGLTWSRAFVPELWVSGGHWQAIAPSLGARMLGLGAMAFAVAALWTLLSSPSQRLFDGEPCPARDGARAGRSLYFWCGFAGLVLYLRLFPALLTGVS